MIPCLALDIQRPMWKPEHRRAADRRGLRYPSDLTDAEWGIVAPMIPPGRHCGRRRSVNVRDRSRGRKRHILVDTLGLLLNVVVHPADIQDRDGAFHLLRRARQLFQFIERIFADGGYAGRKMAMTVWRTGAWSLQIVKRSDAAGFEVLPKRWIVNERSRGLVVTVAWLATSNATQRPLLHSSASP